MSFNSHFSKSIAVDDFVIDDNDCVERAGYVGLSTQIRQYKEAGVLLRATRALAYDSDNPLPDYEKLNIAFRDVKDYADLTELRKMSAAAALAAEKLQTVSQENKNESLVKEALNDE